MRQEAVKEWIFIVYSGHVCRLRKTGPGFSAEYEPQTEMLPSGRLVPEIDARIWDVDRNSEFVCLNPFLAIVSDRKSVV